MEIQLQTRKISVSMTAAGLHEKKSERSIQTVKRKLAATKAALPYILPPILEAEAYITVIRLRNIVPTTNTSTLIHMKSSQRRSQNSSRMHLEC